MCCVIANMESHLQSVSADSESASFSEMLNYSLGCNCVRGGGSVYLSTAHTLRQSFLSLFVNRDGFSPILFAP